MFAVGSFFLSIVWALAITLLLLVVLHLLMKSLFPSHSYNLPVVAILLLVAILIFWQSVRMVGAFYVKGYVNDMSDVVAGLAKSGEELLDQTTYTLADLEEIKQTASKSYPFLQKYIDGVDLKDLNSKGVLQSVQSVVYKQINKYIWARVGWMFVWMVVASVALYYAYSSSARKTRKAPVRRRNYDWD